MIKADAFALALIMFYHYPLLPYVTKWEIKGE